MAISFSPVVVKAVGLTGVGPSAIAFWRVAFGAIFLFALAAARGRSLALAAPVLRWCLFAAFAFFLDLAFWHRSILWAGAGMSTILGNTQVFFTAALGYFLFRERLTPIFFLAAASALAGLTLLVGLWSATVEFTPTYVRGIVYGLLTGVVYAHYLVGIKKAATAASRPDLVTMMAWTTALTAVLLGAWIALFERERFLPQAPLAWLGLAGGLGLLVQTAGWWAIAHSLARLHTARVSLVLLLQPVLATIWGYFLFAEVLAPLQLVGAAITLGAIYAGSARR